MLRRCQFYRLNAVVELFRDVKSSGRYEWLSRAVFLHVLSYPNLCEVFFK